jgi:multidrug efflux pump subunit AcrB
VRALDGIDFDVPRGMIFAILASAGQQFQYTLQTKGRLSEVSEFADIVIRARADSSIVHLQDVARIELDAATYGWFGRLNGRPATVIAVFQLPDANALEVARGVRERMVELAERFPPKACATTFVHQV